MKKSKTKPKNQENLDLATILTKYLIKDAIKNGYDTMDLSVDDLKKILKILSNEK